MKHLGAKRTTQKQMNAIVSLYQQRIGTIHGLAVVFDASIGEVKKVLDDYGVPHGKYTGSGHCGGNAALMDLIKRGQIG